MLDYNYNVGLFTFYLSSTLTKVSFLNDQLLLSSLKRLDPSIQDKKGLEILTLLSLLSFLDTSYFVSPPTSEPSISVPPIPIRKNSMNGVSAVSLPVGGPRTPWIGGGDALGARNGNHGGTPVGKGRRHVSQVLRYSSLSSQRLYAVNF